MKLGWLCDSILNAIDLAAADIDNAGVLARPLHHRLPRVGSFFRCRRELL